jgi:hypothetical protein
MDVYARDQEATMDTTDAWQRVFALSSGNQWRPIPSELKALLGLRSDIGISGGVLCTRAAAIGLNAFIARLNALPETISA